jgi:hypothetical protein
MPRLRWLAGMTVFAAALIGCREKLTAPANCPTDCPGGQVVLDTVLSALPAGDTSFTGYVKSGQGVSLRVSDRLPASEDRAFVRFTSRSDSVFVPGDSNRTYTVDSVALETTLQARDTSVKGLSVYFYRLPLTIDTNSTFADIDGALVPANFLDSVAVSDTLVKGRLRLVLSGTGLDRIAFTPADSGRLAIGFRIHALSPTGVRLASAATGATGPSFISYVKAAVTDTTKQHQILSRATQQSGFVSQTVLPVDPDLLTVGGAPSARALIRFKLSEYLQDSVQILRASLELIPTGPINGLPHDSAQVEARNVLTDLGAKSPTGALIGGPVGITEGAADTVRIEIVSLVRSWQGSSPLPGAVIVSLLPEGSSFARPVFYSTRSLTGQPRLRITYAPRFTFQRP